MPYKLLNQEINLNVLIICYDNRNLSVIAEAMLKKHLEEIGKTNLTIKSCGIAVSDKITIDERATKVLNKLNINIAEYVPTQITQDLIDWADVIYCMNHHQFLSVNFNYFVHKTKIVKYYLGCNKSIDRFHPYISDEDYEIIVYEIENRIKFL